ncbi:hypothetical protein GCM10010177_45270 [Actinomadura citrea]|nr:hypothetical protein GCM10010177_45270 [Actinomadura citrea]
MEEACAGMMFTCERLLFILRSRPGGQVTGFARAGRRTNLNTTARVNVQGPEEGVGGADRTREDHDPPPVR